MRPYEVMLIFDASLEEETIRAAVDRYAAFIRDRGGEPGKVDRWGKRRFAYELRHKWEGYYLLLEFTAGVELEEELHRMLSLADEVIRHKVIRIPEAALKARATPAAAPAEA
jgi:small subunit ribosomal protein S6